jgi:hypothetical protein
VPSLVEIEKGTGRKTIAAAKNPEKTQLFITSCQSQREK